MLLKKFIIQKGKVVKKLQREKKLLFHVVQHGKKGIPHDMLCGCNFYVISMDVEPLSKVWKNC